MSTESIETDVLVVGAGPVGASLAIELGLHGVRCLVVERRLARGEQPRAKFTNIRSMGLLRRWGIAARVREAAPLPASFPSDISFVTRLTGWELTRFPNAFSTTIDRSRPFPEPGQQVPQDVLEQVLRDHAGSFPTVSLRQGIELDDFEQLDGGLCASAHAVDGDTRLDIRARYLAACDGARSGVREALGIPMEGATLAANASGVFLAPELAVVNDKPAAAQYWVVTPDAPSILGSLDGVDKWWFHLNEVPDDGRLSDDRIKELFFAAVGARFGCEVLANSPWVAERRIAGSYRRGDAFLLGDAAHLHPPMGGYGMNMGIGDAVDLGWKLASTIRGWGGPGLLASYEEERLPIHRRVVEEAARNYGQNSNRYQEPDLEVPGEAGDTVRRRLGEMIRVEKSREWATLGVQLGYRYENSPIIAADGSPAPADEVGKYVPTSRPGHLLPHEWLDEQQSVYDVLGPDYTLLELGGGPDVGDGFAAAAARVGMPLERVDLRRSPMRDRCEADLVLVRPDQHVGWRGDSSTDANAIVDRLRGAAPVPAS